MASILTGVGHRISDWYGQPIADLVAADPPDLIIVDMVMPPPDGVEVLQTLQEANCAASVLVISGGGGLNKSIYLQIAAGLGVAATLAKPFSATDLLDAVGRLLAGRKAG